VGDFDVARRHRSHCTKPLVGPGGSTVTGRLAEIGLKAKAK